MAKLREMAQAIPQQHLGGLQDEPRLEHEPALCRVEFDGFPRHGKQFAPHAHEAADGVHHVNREVIFGVNHQCVDLANILILAIDLRPRSGRLTAPPRPVVSSATAEEQKQYDYYQDSFHIITTYLSWIGKQIVLWPHLHLFEDSLPMPGLSASASISDPAGTYPISNALNEIILPQVLCPLDR